MTDILTIDAAIQYLRSQGESDEKLGYVRGGFDTSRPIYFHDLEEGDVLYQYVRVGSHLGNWFALKGASMDDLAIFGGHSGRRLFQVEIIYPCRVVEGSALGIPMHWSSVGAFDEDRKMEKSGRVKGGGGTQLFMPSKYILTCVKSTGQVKHA